MKKKFIVLFLLLYPIFSLATDKVDINTATLEQLDTLVGIGPKYAQAIIDGRPYSFVDDLLRVKGIGEITLQKIKDQGLACVNCSTVIPSSTGNPESTAQTLDSRLRGNDTDNTPAITYPTGVFINEILPNPEGADETEEWVELYNSNNFEVDLSGWKIEDAAGTKTSFLISKKVLAYEYLIFKRPETKIMLNNDIDGLVLLSPDQKIADSAKFSKALLGQSYNRTSNGWAWSATLTPGSQNVIPLSTKKQNSQNSLSNSNNSGNNNLTASISDSINPVKNSVSNGANPWFLFFTTLALTIISAVIVLFIRFRFKN